MRESIYRIIEESSIKDKDGHKLYKLECKFCGYQKIARKSSMFVAEKCTHRMMLEPKIKNKRLRIIFKLMKGRCYNNTNKSFRFYGAKGIRICDEWLNNPLKFEEWAIENGYRDDLSIDRINSLGNYEPQNCRWISKIQNAKFKSNTNIITVKNISMSGRDWSKFLGRGVNYVNTFIRKNGLEPAIKKIESMI